MAPIKIKRNIKKIQKFLNANKNVHINVPQESEVFINFINKKIDTMNEGVKKASISDQKPEEILSYLENVNINLIETSDQLNEWYSFFVSQPKKEGLTVLGCEISLSESYDDMEDCLIDAVAGDAIDLVNDAKDAMSFTVLGCQVSIDSNATKVKKCLADAATKAANDLKDTALDAVSFKISGTDCSFNGTNAAAFATCVGNIPIDAASNAVDAALDGMSFDMPGTDCAFDAYEVNIGEFTGCLAAYTGNAIGDAASTVATAGANVVSGLVDKLNEFLEKIQGLLGSIEDIYTTVKDKMVSLATDVTDKATSIGNTIVDTANDFINGITGIATNIASELSKVSIVFTTIKDTVNTITSTFTTIYETFLTIVTSLWDFIVSLGETILWAINALPGYISSSYEHVLTAFDVVGSLYKVVLFNIIMTMTVLKIIMSSLFGMIKTNILDAILLSFIILAVIVGTAKDPDLAMEKQKTLEYYLTRNTIFIGIGSTMIIRFLLLDSLIKPVLKDLIRNYKIISAPISLVASIYLYNLLR
jgi:hypothetical protein